MVFHLVDNWDDLWVDYWEASRGVHWVERMEPYLVDYSAHH